MSEYEINPTTGERLRIADNIVLSQPISEPESSCTAEEMAQEAQQGIRAAIKAVKAAIRAGGLRPSDLVAASAFLRDTAHGKPGQQVTIVDMSKRDEVISALYDRLHPMIDATPATISGNEVVKDSS